MTGSQKKKRRSAVERVVVWGSIAALAGVALIEARARYGYSSTLAAVQRQFQERGDAAAIHLAEIDGDIAGFPARVELQQGQTRFVCLSWWSLFKSYTIRFTVGLSGDVLAFETDVDIEAEREQLAGLQSTPETKAKIEKEHAEARLRRAADEALENAGLDQRAPDQKLLTKVSELSRDYQPAPLPAGSESLTAEQFKQRQREWLTRLLLDNYRKYGERSSKWNDEATQFLVDAAELQLAESNRTAKTGEVIAAGEALLQGGCTDPLVGYLYAHWKRGGVRGAPANELDAAIARFGERRTYRLSFVFKATLVDGNASAERWAQLGAASRDGQDSAAIDSIRLVQDESDPLEQRFLYDLAVNGSAFQSPRSALRVLKALYVLPSADRWLKSMIAGRYYFEAARGAVPGRTPDEIYEQRRTLYRTARVHFLEGWSIDDRHPEPAASLLACADALMKLGADGSLAGEPPRFWFDQAVKAQFDYPAAYSSMRSALAAANWGEWEPVLEFGRECLATGRFDTRVPLVYAEIVGQRVDEAGQRVYALPGIYEGYERLHLGYAATGSAAKADFHKSHLLAVSIVSVKREESIRLLEELGDDVDTSVVSQYKINLNSVRKNLFGKHRNHRLFPELNASVFDLTFVGDSNRLMTANGNDGVFGLWDVEQRSLVAEFKHENELAAKCSASPDGKRLATTGGRGNVFLWDAKAGTILHTLPHDLQVYQLKFSSDGGRLATATTSDKDRRGVLCVWNAATGALVAKRTHPTSYFHSVDFTGDGKSLVAAGGSYHPDLSQRPGEVVVWDYEQDRDVRRLNLFSGITNELSVNRRQKLLAVTGWDNHFENEKVVYGNRIRIVDLNQGQVIRTFHCGKTLVTDLVFLGDTGLLIVTGNDASIQLWDAQNARLIARMTGHQFEFWKIAVNAAGDRLASLDAGGVIRLWELDGTETPSQVQGSLYEHAFYPNGSIRVERERKRIWTNYPDYGVTAWSEENNYLAERAYPTPQHRSTLDFDVSPDGTMLATVGGTVTEDASLDAAENAGFIFLWDTATGKLVHELEKQQQIVRSVRFSADGRTLATGGKDRNVVLWNLQTMQPWPWGRLAEHNGPINAVAFSADGKYLATGAGMAPPRTLEPSGMVKLWRLPENPDAPAIRLASLQTESVTGSDGGIQSLTFSPDGRTLAVSGFAATQLYAVEPWQKKFLARGRAAAFLHDGSRFATGENNEVHVYEADTGNLVKLFQLPGAGAVFSVGFLSPDTLVAPSPEQKRLTVWSIETGTELDGLPKLH